MTPEAGKETGTDEAVRAPDGTNHHEAFEAWYVADPRHANSYDDVLANWDRMALAARTPAAEAIGRRTSRAAASRRPAMAFAAVAAVVLIVLTGIGLLQLGGLRPGPADSNEIAAGP